MAKVYDPIMCMLVDEPTKAQDAEKLHYYQHSYTKKWYVVSPDGKVFKEFNTEAEAKNYVNGKAKDESEKYAVTMKNSSGKEQHTQGWDLGSIRNWIKDNEKRGYRVIWKNFDSKTIDKAKYYNALDEAIKACDASTGHKVVVFVENYLRSIGKNNSTGKYDRIVQGVRSLLSQSLLDDEGLKKAAEHEADRLLKKYNL